MARASFVSFHYGRDHWRVQQILRMGALDQQPELPAQEWEAVKRKGAASVQAWIDHQMNYKQSVIVLVGNQTASREFVRYEIQRAWAIKKPLLGIRIHGLKDSQQNTDLAGRNPFEQFTFRDSPLTYADFVPLIDPADYTGKLYPSSTDIYAAIKSNIGSWANAGYKRP